MLAISNFMSYIMFCEERFIQIINSSMTQCYDIICLSIKPEIVAQYPRKFISFDIYSLILSLICAFTLENGQTNINSVFNHRYVYNLSLKTNDNVSRCNTLQTRYHVENNNKQLPSFKIVSIVSCLCIMSCKFIFSPDFPCTQCFTVPLLQKQLDRYYTAQKFFLPDKSSLCKKCIQF